MPMTPGLQARNFVAAPQVAAAPQPPQALVANNLQGVGNGPTQGAVAAAADALWRPWVVPSSPPPRDGSAPAPGPPCASPGGARPAGSPVDAPAPRRPSTGASPVARQDEFADYLRQSNPALSVALDLIAEPGKRPAECPLPEGVHSFPYFYVRVSGQPRLSKQGRTSLAYEQAVFELSRLHRGGVIDRTTFNDFASRRSIDTYLLSRYLTNVRNRLPDGSERLPTVAPLPRRTEAANSPWTSDGTAEPRLSDAFLRHLDQVNHELRVALHWLVVPPASRISSLREFASLLGATRGVDRYAHAYSTNLTECGERVLTYERAAFDWIQLGRPASELPAFALDRGLNPSTVKRHVTRASAKLAMGGH